MESVSNLQKVILIRFMSINKGLINKKSSKGVNKKKWQVLSTLLNMEKNGLKTNIDKWEKV